MTGDSATSNAKILEDGIGLLRDAIGGRIVQCGDDSLPACTRNFFGFADEGERQLSGDGIFDQGLCFDLTSHDEEVGGAKQRLKGSRLRFDSFRVDMERVQCGDELHAPIRVVADNADKRGNSGATRGAELVCGGELGTERSVDGLLVAGKRAGRRSLAWSLAENRKVRVDLRVQSRLLALRLRGFGGFHRCALFTANSPISPASLDEVGRECMGCGTCKKRIGRERRFAPLSRGGSKKRMFSKCGEDRQKLVISFDVR